MASRAFRINYCSIGIEMYQRDISVFKGDKSA